MSPIIAERLAGGNAAGLANDRRNDKKKVWLSLAGSRVLESCRFEEEFS